MSNNNWKIKERAKKFGKRKPLPPPKKPPRGKWRIEMASPNRGDVNNSWIKLQPPKINQWYNLNNRPLPKPPSRNFKNDIFRQFPMTGSNRRKNTPNTYNKKPTSFKRKNPRIQDFSKNKFAPKSSPTQFGKTGYGNRKIREAEKLGRPKFTSNPVTVTFKKNQPFKRSVKKNRPKKKKRSNHDGTHSRMFSAPNSAFKRAMRKPPPPTKKKPKHLINKMYKKPNPPREKRSPYKQKKNANVNVMNNPIMLTSSVTRITPKHIGEVPLSNHRVSRIVKITKRPKSTSSIKYEAKRLKYNSLLISQSRRTEGMHSSEYLFAGPLKLKQKKKLLSKRWLGYYSILTKDRELIFYDSIESRVEIFRYDLSQAAFICRENLVVQISCDTFQNDVKIKVPTNILYNEWVTYFSLCGMNEIKSDEYMKKSKGVLLTFQKWETEENNEKSKFFKKPFLTWSIEETLEWLKYIRLSYDETAWDLYRVGFEDQAFDGEKIKKIFMQNEEDMEDSFDDLSICDDLHQLILKKEILKMSKTNFFDTTAFVVQNKMEAMFIKRCGKVGKPFPDFLNYCKHFHRADLLKKTIKHILTKYEKVKNGKKIYKAKFIMTENLQNWRSKQLRKFIGLPLSMANKVGLTDIKFGMFHAALSIGPLQLEWVDNSLVLIRSISSEKVLICVDIGFYEVENLDKFSQRLADEVLKWNREYMYDTMNFKHKKFHANCQQFVEYIVTGILGMRLEFSDDIENFLKKLKDKGNSEMVFRYNNEFANLFGLENNIFKPNSHTELDTFMIKLLKKCKKFPTKYPSQWELLKGFDRAFWMKLYSDLKVQMNSGGQKKKNVHDIEIDYDSQFAPLKEGCPFNMRSSDEEFKIK